MDQLRIFDRGRRKPIKMGRGTHVICAFPALEGLLCPMGCLEIPGPAQNCKWESTDAVGDGQMLGQPLGAGLLHWRHLERKCGLKLWPLAVALAKKEKHSPCTAASHDDCQPATCQCRQIPPTPPGCGSPPGRTRSRQAAQGKLFFVPFKSCLQTWGVCGGPPPPPPFCCP